MKPAVMGVRMHSGWGAVVAVTSDSNHVSVIARERIEVIDLGAGGKKQPYHCAREMPLGAAEKYLARCAGESTRLAHASIHTFVENLQNRGYRLAVCVVLTASGRALPPLAAILASHPLIHTAEGEFFRNVIRAACESMKIAVSGVREREIESQARATLGKSTTAAMKQIANAGKVLGPPWTQDHKKAALAAWAVLCERKKKRPAS